MQIDNRIKDDGKNKQFSIIDIKQRLINFSMLNFKTYLHLVSSLDGLLIAYMGIMS